MRNTTAKILVPSYSSALFTLRGSTSESRCGILCAEVFARANGMFHPFIRVMFRFREREAHRRIAVVEPSPAVVHVWRCALILALVRVAT